jgi:O-antigen ligase
LNLSLLGGRLRDRLLDAGRWSVLLCLFSVPINKPATNIFIFLALIFTALGSDARARFKAATHHPVALGAMIWFLALLASALFGPPGPEGWQTLGVYKALLYPLIVMTLINTEQWRRRALMSFGLSAGLILLISLTHFGIIVSTRTLAGLTGTESFTAFKNYTQEGVAFVVLASLAAAFAHHEQVRWRKFAFWAVAAAALGDVIFVLQSRTAYLIVALLLLYWCWRLIAEKSGGWRRPAAGILVLLAIGGAALSAPRMQERIGKTKQDVEQYSTNGAATSLGIRFELWQKTIPIIRSAPWFGHGLGQWQNVYDASVKDLPGYKPFIMGHPHQEALLILAEQGVVGLAGTILLLFLLIAYARRLESPYRDFYLCLVIIYVAAGLTNCILVDFSHRHVFLMLLALIPLAPAAAHAVRKTGSA